MNAYIGTFDGWAQKKEGSLGEQIINLGKEIADLKAEIGRLVTAMIALGAVAGVALPAVAVGAFFAGPFAPLVIAIGLIFAVGTVATITGLAFKVNGASVFLLSASTRRELGFSDRRSI